jgi:hypothetical protein
MRSRCDVTTSSRLKPCLPRGSRSTGALSVTAFTGSSMARRHGACRRSPSGTVSAGRAASAPRPVGLAIYRGRHGDAALERTIGAVMSWADEYRAGDHEGVWRKLTELGPGLRQDCAAWDDATEVARETMRHVRANVERLHAALLEDGYRFDRPDDALVAPAADAHDRLDQVERVVGPLPLSLRGWF